MKRIIYDVPRWNIYLHRRERKLPRVTKQDKPLLAFQDELFDRLYSGDSAKLTAKQIRHDLKKAVPWAEHTHALCETLDVDKIAANCKHKATEAALATEWVMSIIAPQVSQPSQQQQQQQNAAADAAQGFEQVEMVEKEEVRPPTDTKRIDQVAELLKDDERLKKIALLAGRFKRVLISKQKTKIRHDCDEIADIEQGGELTRLLPSELVKFLSPKLKQCVTRDLFERKCLQYSMQATETLGRGPMIMCVDKSGSMAEGDKDIWATAIALALLDMAHRQKRTFILLGFDDEVFQKVVVRVGKPIPKEHLCVAPRGGTDIAKVLDLALNATETRKIMRRADIVLITDGESDDSRAEEIRERAKRNDVTILGIGIGVRPEAVKPWCDETHFVTDMGELDDKTAGALFGGN